MDKDDDNAQQEMDEKRRRFYMLLQNGWRQMTNNEREVLGREIARVFQYICPVGWDVNGVDSLNCLKMREAEEIARDKERVSINGGVWVDCM